MDYESPESEDSSFPNVFNIVIDFLEIYGWYLLIVFVVVMMIYHKTLKSYLEKYRAYKFERDYAAKYHKNPDVFAAHVNAQQQWTQKMQEKYNKESEQYKQKMQEREEKKKQEFMEKYGHEGGHVLGSKKDDKRNNSKTDFPLMGSGSSPSYRPPRRSPCGGGGCGR